MRGSPSRIRYRYDQHTPTSSVWVSVSGDISRGGRRHLIPVIVRLYAIIPEPPGERNLLTPECSHLTRDAMHPPHPFTNTRLADPQQACRVCCAGYALGRRLFQSGATAAGAGWSLSGASSRSGYLGHLFIALTRACAAQMGQALRRDRLRKSILRWVLPKARKAQGVVGDMVPARGGATNWPHSVPNRRSPYFIGRSLKPGLRAFAMKLYTGKTSGQGGPQSVLRRFWAMHAMAANLQIASICTRLRYVWPRWTWATGTGVLADGNRGGLWDGIDQVFSEGLLDASLFPARPNWPGKPSSPLNVTPSLSKRAFDCGRRHFRREGQVSLGVDDAVPGYSGVFRQFW